MHDLCRSLKHQRDVGIRGLALFLSYGAQLGIENTDGKTAINYLERYKPWISRKLREKHEEISQERQKKLKQAYFTEVAEVLRELPQYRDSVDEAFLNYIKEAGVEDTLVSALRAKTVF